MVVSSAQCGGFVWTFSRLLVCWVSAIALAAAWSPADGYAPGFVACPGRNLLRAGAGDSLHPDEQQYVWDRQATTRQAFSDYVSRVGLSLDARVLESNITYGIAASGGGFRAMLSGAGQIMALDSRTPGSLAHGHVGGILQGAMYMSGLSGGGWLLASMYVNNYSSVYSILHSDELWQLQDSIVDLSVWTNPSSVDQVVGDPLRKHSAGFPISLTDLFGRALSQKFVAGPSHGVGTTWSAMRSWRWYATRTAPFPILVFNGRVPGDDIRKQNALIFEATPLELGSADPPLVAYADLKYIGTRMESGYPADTNRCVEGFDNANFIYATSSSIFDAAIKIVLDWIPGHVGEVIRTIFFPAINKLRLIVGVYAPNPFYRYSTAPSDSNSAGSASCTMYSTPDSLSGRLSDLTAQSPLVTRANGTFNPASSVYTSSRTLFLADGGYNLQVIPVQPLLHHARRLDAIIVLDNTGDNNHWPTGSSLSETYGRQFLMQANWNSPVAFPYFPDTRTMATLNFTRRPVFFGCDGSNLTSLSPVVPPLIVYIPNAHYSYASNKDYLQLRYSVDEKFNMTQNGYNAASFMNSTQDPDWPVCLGCALAHRKAEQFNVIADQCQRCMQRYCWDGTLTV